MQPLTAPPRDGLTQAQVLSVLRDAPAVEYSRGLEVLDLKSLNVIADISDWFLSGQVARDCDATVHGTCSLVVAADVPVDFTAQLLRPYMVCSAGGVAARFNCGVYVPSVPTTNYGESVPSMTVAGSDRLSQLNRPIGDAYTTHVGNDYITEILNVLATAGIFRADTLVDGTAAATTIPGQRTWPMLSSSPSLLPVDAVGDGSNATTYLQVVNALLAECNYRGVWQDWDGRFRADPYIDPAVRTPEFAFDFDDDLAAVIARARSRTRDISGTPNRWIFVQSNLVDESGAPLAPVEGIGQYTVQNFDDGDTSINARGGWPIGAVNRVVVLDAADQATLVALGDRQVAADRAVATTFSWSSSPFPAAWHEDVYTYDDDELAPGAMKVVSSGWTLDFGDSTGPPADMRHTLRLVG